MKVKQYILPVGLITLISMIFLSQVMTNKNKPKLVLQITVDQLRGDLLARYSHRFSENGFNYLLNKGTVYHNAHHGHANTETIVGHVTLSTGAYPSGHGLVGNIWYDRKLGNTVYNIEDANYKLLTKGAGIDKSTEVDPTQKAANVDGRSPSTIKASTFSDEMVIASNGEAKVFGVSVKDRGAVAMAGHGGKAIWFSKATQKFVSSDYYYQTNPQWLNDWNSKKIPQQYANKSWELSKDQSTYLYAKDDDNAWEAELGGYGRVFPHPFGDKASPYFSTLLTISPVGDEMTLDIAKSLIINEKLGQDNITDYLSLSFSSTDYVGHFFGISSLESEDNLLRLDKTIANLLAFIDQEVGLENTIIVLSADHGGPDVPSYLQEKQLLGKYIDLKSWDSLPEIIEAKKKLDISERLVIGYYHPYIYLDEKVIKKSKYSLAEVQDVVSSEIMKNSDIHRAVASHRVENNLLVDNKFNRAIINNYYPERSGDIYIVFRPQEFINDLGGLKVAGVHGSPWTYDTFVPIIFAGMDVPAQHVYNYVETIDVAPTLSALLNIKEPSVSQGNVLTEVLMKPSMKWIN